MMLVSVKLTGMISLQSRVVPMRMPLMLKTRKLPVMQSLVMTRRLFMKRKLLLQVMMMIVSVRSTGMISHQSQVVPMRIPRMLKTRKMARKRLITQLMKMTVSVKLTGMILLKQFMKMTTWSLLRKSTRRRLLKKK